MAKTESFDITTGLDLQEVDNAVNQTDREISNRYDFKGVPFEMTFDRARGRITVLSAGEYQLDAIWTVFSQKATKRGLPLRNFRREAIEEASGGNARQTITIVQSIDQDTAKKIVKTIKEEGPKKVSASIQGDTVRVSGPSRDDLQATIQLLKGKDFGMELTFGNYR